LMMLRGVLCGDSDSQLYDEGLDVWSTMAFDGVSDTP
jgi:hypothetical protein